MLLRISLALILSLATTFAHAQDLTNHALGKPYSVSPAPSPTYADDTGPQAHAPGEFYTGELTDGVTGPTNFKSPEWVGWRDTSYRDPIVVELDLQATVWLDEVVVTVCGGSGGVVPPAHVDLQVISPDFPFEAFVTVGRMFADEPDGAVYTFRLDGCGLRTSRVRLLFEEVTWNYLMVDEIQVLGGTAGEPDLLPVMDVTVEAEDSGEGVEVAGASGAAVSLDRPGDAFEMSLPLPAGDYTVRVRSMGREQDVFAELAVSANGEPLRAHPITNTVFTWQRSHFTQDQDGPAAIAISLVEGPGVYVDQVRIHRLTRDEPIKELREFALDTILAEGGEARCLIATDDAGDFAAQAEALATVIEKRAGVRPVIKSGLEVTAEELRATSVIGLGVRTSNFALLRARPNAWGRLPDAPDDGSPQVYVAVEPFGTGVNVIQIGGRDAVQVAASVDAFTDRLTGDATLAYPYELVPAPVLTGDRERYRQLAVDSGKWLREGALRTIFNRWKAFSDDLFVMFGYRYLEYLDSPDTVKRASDSGFIEAETFKIVTRFDRSEHNGYLDRRQRLQMTNLLLRMSRECAGKFDWNCCQEPGVKKRHHTPDECTRILAERPPAIAHNHQTFPVYSIVTAGDYFAKYYGLPEATQSLGWAEAFMRGPLRTGKPMCDCWGYQDITMIHTARYAAIVGDWDYFEREAVRDFLRLRYMSHDNMGAGVGYGDVGGYSPGGGPDFLAGNARNWITASGGRLDPRRIGPDGLLGVYVHPLEPMWHDYYGATVPLDDCFDKISFRDAVDPDRAYLLLDGLSKGYHGHWDGNSILRFTDNGRVWLCEGDYLKGALKDHNTLTVMRDTESAAPGMFSSLEARFESPAWAGTITRTADYCGLDWDRHLIWRRASDLFILIDEVTAKQPGLFDINARFRSLGEAKLAGRVWTVEQAGGQRFHLHAPGPARLTEASEPADAKNWRRYEFVDDSTPKLLSHRIARQMQPGDRQILPCVFYADDRQGDAPHLRTRALGPDAFISDGELRIVAGVEGLDADGLRAEARQFVIGPDEVFMIGGVSLATDRPLLTADRPVNISLDLRTGSAIIEAPEGVDLGISCDEASELVVDGQVVGVGPGGPLSVTLSPGRHELAGAFTKLAHDLDQTLARLWQQTPDEQSGPPPRPTSGVEPTFALDLPAPITALTVGDITGDDAAELVVGCADGALVVFDAGGAKLWERAFAGQVNAIELADLDEDGRADIVCGVEDALLWAATGDGTELLARRFETRTSSGGGEGHVRALHVADFDGDGGPEIAVACANTMCYVLAPDGEVMTTDGRAWELIWRHKGSAVGAADTDGDGRLELLAGYTYFTRWIVDFFTPGRAGRTVVPGSIAGCGAIAAADLDGDGIEEAIFADRDGVVTVCRRAAGSTAADVVWTKTIGDDAHEHMLVRDLDGDGLPEIALASRSGFLALVGADGAVRWAAYADNQVTDVALAGSNLLARSSADGSVAVYDAAGAEVARWLVGAPVQLIEAHDGTLVAAAGSSLLAATLIVP
jgi:hypothetical protein